MTTVWRVSGFIWAFIVALLCFATAIPVWIATYQSLLGFWFLILAAVITVLCFLLLCIILPPIRYMRWRYAVREDEIEIYRGIIVHKHIVVPLVRVQFIDTAQGPIMRPFGLASINISTAAGEQSIPGLLLPDADALRNRVADLAKLVHEDV
jgi:membrane protein YdbS with pleckstrin-like domain